jgi:hypothetical protein
VLRVPAGLGGRADRGRPAGLRHPEFTRSGRGAGNLSRYLPILTEGWVCELRREADEVRLLFSFVEPVGLGSRQLPEFGTTLMVRICEPMTGHRVRPVRVELRHETACPMLARHLGVPVTVNRPHAAIVLDAASLAVPVVKADARLLDMLRRYADDVLARRASEDDLVARAERWILTNLHTGDLGRARLARGLGMSARTLARRLAEGGLTPAAWSTGCAGSSPPNIWRSLTFSSAASPSCWATATAARSRAPFAPGPVGRRRSGGRSCYRPRSLRQHRRRRSEAGAVRHRCSWLAPNALPVRRPRATTLRGRDQPSSGPPILPM